MKKLFVLCVVFVLNSFSMSSQDLENVNFISPFNDGLAAIQKDGKWAFINEKGTIVINFRSDLVVTEISEGSFPVFRNNRCMIKAKRNGISYFGYISTCGKVAIKPQYLNALNFNDGLAIVLELIKEQVGTNEALGKNVVYDKYLEAVIDVDGNVKGYISPKRTNILLDKKFLRQPPKITTKRISERLYALWNENDTWTIKVVH